MLGIKGLAGGTCGNHRSCIIHIVNIHFVTLRMTVDKKSGHIGEFEQLALLAVMRLGDSAYGAPIQRELEATAGRRASISAIYITLTRLQDKGLVSSWMGAPTEARGGKKRRFFKVGPAGVAALDRARSQLLSMWDGLEGDLEGARAK